MIGNVNLFTLLDRRAYYPPVAIADSSFVLVFGIGIIHINKHLILLDVFYVSKFLVNLLSVTPLFICCIAL